MKINKNILVFDLIIQSIIIGIAFFSVIFGMLYISNLTVYFLCQLAMGIWQVVSAIAIVILTREFQRIYYLAAVVLFFIVAGLLSYFAFKITIDEKVFLSVLWIAIPLIFAAWYYLKTYKDVKKIEKMINVSFEENEAILDTKDFV